jgi:hypothetical protein
MSACCSPRGYRRVFNERSAAAAARRYRRKGLDRTSRRLVDVAIQRGVQDRTLLEVGGGVGALQVELLRSGARYAVSVELTPTHERAAAVLLRTFALSSRVERRIADFTQTECPDADIVVLNRVVCCYPDMPRLATAAADHSRGLLLISFPKVTWWTRALLQVGNTALRLFRAEFQVFLHPPDRIREAVERRGLRLVVDRPGCLWQVFGFERQEPRLFENIEAPAAG